MTRFLVLNGNWNSGKIIRPKKSWNVSTVACTLEWGSQVKTKPPEGIAEQNWTIFSLPLTQVNDWMRVPFSESAPQPDFERRGRVCKIMIINIRWNLTDLPFYKFWIFVRVSCHSYEINILLYFPTSYLCEQAFSLSLKTVTEIILFQLKMRSVYVSLKIDSELTIYVAKDKQRFHIIFFSFKNNILCTYRPIKWLIFIKINFCNLIN